MENFTKLNVVHKGSEDVKMNIQVAGWQAWAICFGL